MGASATNTMPKIQVVVTINPDELAQVAELFGIDGKCTKLQRQMSVTELEMEALEHYVEMGVIESIEPVECKMESLVVVHINKEKLAIAASLFGGDSEGELASEIKMTITDEDFEALEQMENMGIVERVSLVAGPCCTSHTACERNTTSSKKSEVDLDEWVDAKPLSLKISKLAYANMESPRGSAMTFASAANVPVMSAMQRSFLSLIDADGSPYVYKEDGCVEI